MNFNWRGWWRRNIPIDRVAERIAGLGIPGLVLLGVMGATGFYGGAAIVTALATLGGPLGMLGGIALLGMLVFISSAISRFGIEQLFKSVLEKLKEQGKTEEEILQEIDRYPIAEELKLKLKDYIENMKFEGTDEFEEISPELSERMQEILSIIEPIIHEDLGQLESRLNEKIGDVKKDLNSRMNRSEAKLKWFIGIAVAVGSILTTGIVALIVGFLN